MGSAQYMGLGYSLIRQLRLAISCLLILVVQDSGAQAQSPNRLVTIETGEIPVILSAPHGGQDSIPGVTARRGVGVERFKNKSDAFTSRLTESLADAIEKRLGKRPYVVIAHFHRKYADANRPVSLAYESEKAAATYEAYHQGLSTARNEVIERWGHGILLDIHGQAAEPKAIFRGTQNGKTTRHLVQRFGREALVGQSSLFGQIAKQGLQVIPAVGASDAENPAYDGGHIVTKYGSRQYGTLDAIQLELGWDLRSPGLRTATANKLATAVAAFAGEYLRIDDTTKPARPKEIDREVITCASPVIRIEIPFKD